MGDRGVLDYLKTLPSKVQGKMLVLEFVDYLMAPYWCNEHSCVRHGWFIAHAHLLFGTIIHNRYSSQWMSSLVSGCWQWCWSHPLAADAPADPPLPTENCPLQTAEPHQDLSHGWLSLVDRAPDPWYSYVVFRFQIKIAQGGTRFWTFLSIIKAKSKSRKTLQHWGCLMAPWPKYMNVVLAFKSRLKSVFDSLSLSLSSFSVCLSVSLSLSPLSSPLLSSSNQPTDVF